MIEFPREIVPNGAAPAMLDFGAILRPQTGGAADRLNRKGSRFRVGISTPPLDPEVARVGIARLLRAQSEGLRVEFPLAVPQGSPGAPVVDGAGQAGTTINLRGLTPGYVAREGYWLSIVDASGQHFLHNVAAMARADVAGDMAVTITPELRTAFADGAAVHLARPMIEGLVQGNEREWAIPVHGFIALEFTVEESA